MTPTKEQAVKLGADGMTKIIKDRESGQDAWYVVFKGRLLSPSFNSPGAADAYMVAVIRGEREPEYMYE